MPGPDQASMQRTARNLAPRAAELDPCFMDEVHAAVEEADVQRFFLSVSYLLAALRERGARGAKSPSEPRERRSKGLRPRP
jgi:hypothetical protein